MKQYKNTVNTSTHITKTPTQFSEHPLLTEAPSTFFAHLHRKTNNTKSGVYLRTAVHTSFMLWQQVEEHINKCGGSK
jgi:hypothetical protein